MKLKRKDNLNEKAYAFVTEQLARGGLKPGRKLSELSLVANAWRYHCEILNACRRGDTAGAVLWLKRHIASSRRDALLPISKI